MLGKLKELFQQGSNPLTGTSSNEMQLATAALLIEAAQLDGEYSVEEQGKISSLLQKHFKLDETTAGTLIKQAEDKSDNSIQIFGFTRVISDHCTNEERIEIIELLWAVVYADGELHPYEGNLMRRIAGLLHVSDRDSGDARKRALRSLGLAQ